MSNVSLLTNPLPFAGMYLYFHFLSFITIVGLFCSLPDSATLDNTAAVYAIKGMKGDGTSGSTSRNSDDQLTPKTQGRRLEENIVPIPH